jgi:transcriptional regulator with GAF, ATPase, and Fis domain
VTKPVPDFEANRIVAPVAMKMIDILQRGGSKAELLETVLPEVVHRFGGHAGGWVVQASGRWVSQAWVGPTMEIPELLIAEAIDQGSPQLVDSWGVFPFSARTESTSVEPAYRSPTRPAASPPSALVLHLNEPSAADMVPAKSELLQSLVSRMGYSLQRLETNRRQLQRIGQLTAVLDAAADWQRLDDDDALLHRIAGTATDLLDCERASIFLWDRRRKKLIGRPALGVEGDSLEVDDDSGVVGEVLRSAEAKIWNGDSDDESRVNRDVDRSLEFETRSLVAVPMSGQRDDLIGVFEAINHRGEGFQAADAEVLADLASHAAVAIQAQRTRRNLTETRDRLLDDAAATTHLIGEDSKIEAVRRTAAKVAKTDLTVLILGKNGTGKEVLARHIHFESGRRSGPFIAVNCAALVETLLESELFGHEKGAFTDAQATRVGKFELASGGTLFLDEVGDMSPGGQAKLLRVLEEKVVVRVGGSQPIPVDVRVIAATNQPLDELIRQKRFREDLYFRLSVVNLPLPPLAERGDDVLVLAEHFLSEFSYQIGRQVPRLSPDAKAALKSHDWPGNIRELRNTIERVCYLCSDDQIGSEDLMLTSSIAAGGSSVRTAYRGTLGDATHDFQVDHIQRAIDECDGNMTEAAARLGLHRSNLYRKMRQLGMPTSGQ